MCWNKQIRDLRIDHDLTKVQLAKALGVSPKTISRYETGQAEPTISILIKMALLFNVTTDYICGMNNNTDNSNTNLKDEVEHAINILEKLINNL